MIQGKKRETETNRLQELLFTLPRLQEANSLILVISSQTIRDNEFEVLIVFDALPGASGGASRLSESLS